MQPILVLLRLARPCPHLSPVPGAPHVEGDTDEPIAVGRPANEPFAVLPGMPRVTATELWNLYDTNEAEAERRLARRPVYVSGAVDRVGRVGGVYVVQLGVSGSTHGVVRCRVLGGERFKVENLRPGDLAMLLARRVFNEPAGVVADSCLIVECDLTVLPFRARSW